MLAPNLLLL